MGERMSPLERLGLEVVAFTLLGSRGQASMLLALLDAKGRVASWETLSQARKWKMVSDGEASRKSIQVRICHLRESLADIGLEGVIVTAPRGHQKDQTDGYSLPEPGRKLVMDRLLQEGRVKSGAADHINAAP